MFVRLPMLAYESMVACLMPTPSETITTIDVVPITMPSTVKNARSFLRHRFSSAVRSMSKNLIHPPIAFHDACGVRQ